MALIASERPGSANKTRMTAFTEHIYPTGSAGSSPSPVKQKVTKVTFDMIGCDVPSEQMLREIFEQFDTNHNGFIERAEFKNFLMSSVENYGAPLSHSEVDRLMAKLDAGVPPNRRNKNMHLTFEQFSVLVLARIAM